MDTLNAIEESNGDKYLIFASTNKNKEVLEKYTELCDEIKNEIETINLEKPIKYGRDLVKMRFESDDYLPLSRILIPSIIIVVRPILQVDGKYYPQVRLYECLYEYDYQFVLYK